ncbi:MAG: DUF2121 domain-containing protein [Methanomicrobiales archaeon]|nr:DUF2121 domain-containing protein [Methanomicrobiales archaeon]MDI6876356.1 DUF2121 domain-containing protein [Methanomicrobiales archaeon]
MSLVLAFVGTKGAAMAGDMREITFRGDDTGIERLEAELYRGSIRTDEELQRRSREIGVCITVRDDKIKVSQRDGMLVGEVISADGSVVHRRRLYVSTDNYAITEIHGPEIRLVGSGRGSNFVVLGNEIGKKIAHACIQKHWKSGTLRDAIRILMLAMEAASRQTASVSREYVLVQTTRTVRFNVP